MTEPLSAKQLLLRNKASKPAMKAPKFEDFPSSMAEANSWCLWEWVWDDAAKTPTWAKRPKRLSKSGLVETGWNKPEHLLSLREAFDAIAKYGPDRFGIGLVSPGDSASRGEAAALDFDNVVDAKGNITNALLADLLGSTKEAILWERSVSGTGIHAIGMGLQISQPKKFNLAGGGEAELLVNGRFCAVSGDWLHPKPSRPVGSLNGILEAIRRTATNAKEKEPQDISEALARFDHQFKAAHTPPPKGDFQGYLAERARRYVAAMPPSISGQGGHQALMKAVAVLKGGFGYGDPSRAGLWESDGRAIFEDYNRRGDPESEHQIKHKWEGYSGKVSQDLYSDARADWDSANSNGQAIPTQRQVISEQPSEQPVEQKIDKGEELRKAALAAMESPANIEELKPTVWLWPDVIPRGELGFIAGWPGAGKSTAFGGIVASLTRPGGYCGPCGSLPGLPDEYAGEKCLWISCEERSPKIKARLALAGADLEKVRIVSRFAPSLGERKRYAAFPLDLDFLRIWLADFRPSFVVLDSMSGLFDEKADTTKGQALRGKILNELVGLAEDFACSFLLVTHRTKSSMAQQGGPAFLQSEGAVGLAGACRFCLEAAYHPDDASLPKKERRRIVRTTKTQDAAEGFTVPFRLYSATTELGARVQIPKWEAAVYLDDEQFSTSIPSGPKPELRQQAERAIVELLGGQQYKRLSWADIQSALSGDFSEATLRRAKDELRKAKKMETENVNGCQVLRLTEKASEAGQERLAAVFQK